MSNVNVLVKDFLTQNKIAVVGVSDKRETGCNAAYQRFKDARYAVYAINPHQSDFHGDPCYPDLKSVPQKPDAVFILANPGVSEQMVQQCVDLGIKHIWMHCLMGTKAGLMAGASSVSQDAVRLCRENGIQVIPGSSPNQWLSPDFGHKLMRGFSGLMGWQRLN